MSVTHTQVGAGTIADAGEKSKYRPNTKRDTSPSRIPAPDGLRGAAILAVLLFHFIGNVPGGQLGSSLARFQRLFNMSWTGVDLFLFFPDF